MSDTKTPANNILCISDFRKAKALFLPPRGVKEYSFTDGEYNLLMAVYKNGRDQGIFVSFEHKEDDQMAAVMMKSEGGVVSSLNIIKTKLGQATHYTTFEGAEAVAAGQNLAVMISKLHDWVRQPRPAGLLPAPSL